MAKALVGRRLAVDEYVRIVVGTEKTEEVGD